jgi:hypothetical protein
MAARFGFRPPLVVPAPPLSAEIRQAAAEHQQLGLSRHMVAPARCPRAGGRRAGGCLYESVAASRAREERAKPVPVSAFALGGPH